MTPEPIGPGPADGIRNPKRRGGSALAVALGAALGLIVLGPVLRPGSLLNLDLVVTPHIPVPAGVWGLGPELPRRLPFFVPMAWLSTVVDGALVAKLVMVATVAVAFVGVHRLCRNASGPAAIAAGLVYAAGPFLTTRLAVGHFGTALATALLPWALPTLLRPSKDLRRTLLWTAAMGLAGINGGVLAALVLVVGLVADRGQRTLRVVAVAGVAQLPWLVPGVIVMLQGTSPRGSSPFATRLDGIAGPLRLVGGQGFWLPDFEVGTGSWVVPVVAAGLLVLAIAGRSRLDESWGRRATVLAVVGLAVAAASGLPLVRDAYTAFADTPIGAPLREGHRTLALFLVWLAPAAAAGTTRLTLRKDLVGVVMLSCSLAFIGPALWGFGGRVEPVKLPGEWAAARQAVRSDPGPVLPLPWSEYLRPVVIDGRLVHHPAPFLLGGDVLLPSGRAAVDNTDERADPREAATRRAVIGLARAGATVAMDPLGIHWILVVATVDGQAEDLSTDPGLERVVHGDTLSLYRVKGSRPLAMSATGDRVDLHTIAGPLATSPGSTAFTWHRLGADGWLRGSAAATVTEDGTLRVPSGTGPIWYWPAALVLLADAITLVAAGVATYRLRQDRVVLRSDH